jgi:drug/metabolite transporter (DMT)-like permease
VAATTISLCSVDETRRPVDRTWLVACAAALWGTDGLLRKPLADALPAASVVFWEHVIIVALLVPLLPSAARAFAAAGRREQAALLAIGIGPSAIAAVMFTAAFRLSDPITPLVLQKLQPVFVVLAAVALLGERLRAGYFAFAVPALAGAWLLAFRDPTHVRVVALQAALLALGAAALWAAGTVLGRMVATTMRPRQVTTLRFAIGRLGQRGRPGAARGGPWAARAFAVLHRPAGDTGIQGDAGRTGVPGDRGADRRRAARHEADHDAVARLRDRGGVGDRARLA